MSENTGVKGLVYPYIFAHSLYSRFNPSAWKTWSSRLGTRMEIWVQRLAACYFASISPSMNKRTISVFALVRSVIDFRKCPESFPVPL